ncbi:hypothetical protein DFH09DRAFT_1374137, partial [Mycena vulgaris]
MRHPSFHAPVLLHEEPRERSRTGARYSLGAAVQDWRRAPVPSFRSLELGARSKTVYTSYSFFLSISLHPEFLTFVAPLTIAARPSGGNLPSFSDNLRLEFVHDERTNAPFPRQVLNIVLIAYNQAQLDPRTAESEPAVRRVRSVFAVAPHGGTNSWCVSGNSLALASAEPSLDSRSCVISSSAGSTAAVSQLPALSIFKRYICTIFRHRDTNC